MKIKVLGPSGSEWPDHYLSSFLLIGKILGHALRYLTGRYQFPLKIASPYSNTVCLQCALWPGMTIWKAPAKFQCHLLMTRLHTVEVLKTRLEGIMHGCLKDLPSEK